MMTTEEIIKLIFGFKVNYLRQQKQFSYQELSDATGLAISYLHDIEKGRKYPKVNKINLLASALGVDYNYLVSTQASKKIQPIIELIQSDFFKVFPLELFGITPAKLLELFSTTPDKVNAFIGTVTKMARNYQMKNEHFYMAALRSYQDMYDNYFEEIEQAVQSFTNQFQLEVAFPFQPHYLAQLLEQQYQISIDRTTLANDEALRQVRSYFSKSKKILYLNQGLSTAQENFLLGRELAFQYLLFKERPYLTRMEQVDSFEHLLNNFKASYFAVALLMPESSMIEDIRHLAQQTTWQPDFFVQLLNKYDVTPEMLLQRLTNILPHHFGINDLFFLRMKGNKPNARFEMTKELHLSQLHSPYANERDEHYCRRWISVKIIQQIWHQSNENNQPLLINAQISQYWQSPNEYLCIALAKAEHFGTQDHSSVTLGLLINDRLRQLFRFLNDPALPAFQVNTTCERCAVPDCKERAADPVMLAKAAQQEKIKRAVKQLE
jgi:transcriptional regulator with XRE-family HTH domain/Zn-dependent peptidase ImmA (M78 family)